MSRKDTNERGYLLDYDEMARSLSCYNLINILFFVVPIWQKMIPCQEGLLPMIAGNGMVAAASIPAMQCVVP